MSKETAPRREVSYETIEKEIVEIRASMKSTCKKFESRMNELETKLNTLKNL